MAELTADDVEIYTNGRLLASSPQTGQLLAQALAGARRYCGWYVTPVQADVSMVLDGPGTHLLSLPTMNLTDLSAVVEDGVSLDVSTLSWSRQGLVRKTHTTVSHTIGHLWSCKLGALQLTVTHGYSEADAADWRGAVLAACDLVALNVGPQLQEYTVDDVLRKWFKSPVFAFNTAVLDNYRLVGVA